MVTKDQRRRQLARDKFERQHERRVQAQRKTVRRNAVVAAVLAVVLAAGATAWAAGAFGPDAKKDDAASADVSPTPAEPSKAPDPCAKPAEGSPGTEQWKKEPAVTVDTAAKYTLALQTTCGDIALDLDAKNAPHTVNSFAFLAGKGYFDHTKCHRLTTSGIYVLQCGDPTGQGTGGPGYTIPDENLKAKEIAGGAYPAGTVAMANTGQAHTGGSQFFLVYKDSPLPPNYTPFGTISAAGMKVLDKISAAGESTGAGDGAPNATVVINKATVGKS
ncbi:peptidylprolyl isomerase [Actinacidiphila glaucinigra]|uniref:peptidylprolyl isomerase n=1 Tax=Actinacidiphila glaucinigra TaxID=235986 RepID=UPI002DDBC03E|nr:peptidylprolyl isomerase [Actinacidiphila glaucinigra]WSD63193.1 peptidylprolyl isomerase [Actinacidiphila glaucinigra]